LPEQKQLPRSPPKTVGSRQVI
jgi:hypothetical protein